MEKQQQLSDWYYIKSNPKSPRLPPRPEKRITTTTSSASAAAAAVATTNTATAAGTVVVSARCSPSMQRTNNQRDNGSMKKRDRYDERRIIGESGGVGIATSAIGGCGGGGNSIDKSNDIINRREEKYAESNEQRLSNQIPNKFVHSMCDEKTNGYSSPAQSMERKRPTMMMHRDQSPIYQQLNQYNNKKQMLMAATAPTNLVGGGNVPNYENHQITPHFHQYQKPPHANSSPRNRTMANQNLNHSPHHTNNINHNNNNNNNVNKVTMAHHQSPAALARFGELTSSSFEHVNVSSCMPDMTVADKQYRSTSNFTNEPDLIDERRIKVMPMPPHRRAVPPVPVQTSPNQTVSLFLCIYQFH